MITRTERDIALACLDFAREAGAQGARITLNKSIEDLIATLDGEVDKVTRCADRSLSIALFVDGSYGSFSVNKMDPESLRDFIFKAAETVRMLAPDPCRVLPDPERCCKTAREGTEMDIYDPAREAVSPDERREAALAAAVTPRCSGKALEPALSCGHEGMRLVSEEGEYSDSVFDTLVVDSQGLECRHTETSFDYGVEVTVEDPEGNKYSDYWWTSSPRRSDFDASDCGAEAIRRACAQAGSSPAPSGKYNMVISRDMASRLVTPLLNALNGYSIQQGNSFLVGSEGKQLFCPGLGIMDEPWRKGEAGSKLFDGEGVATCEAPIIENGTVKRFFINSYMAGKLGMAPTVEDAIRPRVLPWPAPGLDADTLMRECGDGILVTDFNGGNCNMTTGDFSYGISGQLFRDGKSVRPVSEMLITGNFLELWKHLLAAGSDYRPCATKLVGSLAFSAVDFSG
ncbi:MAG: TldD/PmbA family protein [Bacteroidales bacterium]|nr:TldD/PmbA family protein [Bacteroidales bacterium]